MLMALEPIRVTGSKVIFEELDNISMIYFFLSGYFDIGYEINHKKEYSIRKANSEDFA